MSAGPFVLIANPHAGRGQAGASAAAAGAALRAAGCEAREELTTSIAHAAELASAAAARGAVAVAVGGDGLIRAVAAGASGHAGTIGIVPAGRGNDFARTVGLTKDVDASVRVLLDAQPRPTDCIAVTSGVGATPTPDADQATRPGSIEPWIPGLADPPEAETDIALGNVYLGFDSLSNIAANQLRWNLGQLSYAYAALRVTLTMPPHRFELVIDGEPRTFTGSGVTIASSAYYGGAVPVAPGADPHDGVLDVVLFEQTTRRSRTAALWAMRSGRHVARPGVRRLRAREIQVTATPVLEAYSDGDPIAHSPLTARVMPGAIGLLRP